jgi:hypothetical protein
MKAQEPPRQKAAPAEDLGPSAKSTPTSPFYAERDDQDVSPAELDEVAVQLRRRREAALRLPPLQSGYRDPIDELAGCRWSS